MASTLTRINLKSLMYVWYTHTDIDAADKFLTDFGLIRVKATSDKIWYRGFGESPTCYISEKSTDGKPMFLGGGWSVDAYDDLKAAAQLPGASPISKAEDVIGGKKVTLTDPAGGLVHLHWGHHERKIAQDEVPKKLTYNTWDTKSRKGEFQRFDDGPSDIHKLGHYGYEVSHDDFEKSFFVSAGDVTACTANHCSFEVDDFDSEMKGHNFLLKKGWSLVWGIGRHLLGSQIFDYWFDNDGFVLEHYADGDLVNCNNPPQREPASPNNIAMWAPMLPLAFLTRNKEDMGKTLGPPPGAEGPPATVPSG
ncbi:trihydroxytoluene oxygenase [Colletotrichum camelliae]|nr:trihydroxytoluene oxygenase [Colletotrichum camelliae]